MAASANWQCADCDTFNDPEDASCEGCGGTRRSARKNPRTSTPSRTPSAPRTSAPKPPSAARPEPTAAAGPKSGAKPAAGSTGKAAAKRPGASGPPASWQCSLCDTNNARTDLSCIACGTAWKAAVKKPPPPKPSSTAKPSKASKPREPSASSHAPSAGGTGAPKKAAPRRTPPRKPAPKPASATSSTPRTAPRAAGASGASRPRREEAVFFPSAPTTGYRPTATPASPTPAPPVAPRPAYVPRPVPPRRTPAKKKSGCFSGCFGLVVVFGLLSLAGRACDSFGSGDPSNDDARTVRSTPCPERIAAQLPGGTGAELVEAFRTENKQITLCRTASGSLYYFGEFSDGREKGIAMKAEETGDGYTARNDPYRYEVHDGVVTIYRSGGRIGEENLTPEPSPS